MQALKPPKQPPYFLHSGRRSLWKLVSPSTVDSSAYCLRFVAVVSVFAVVFCSCVVCLADMTLIGTLCVIYHALQTRINDLHFRACLGNKNKLSIVVVRLHQRHARKVVYPAPTDKRGM